MYGQASQTCATPKTVRPCCNNAEERKAFVAHYLSTIASYLAKRWRGSRLFAHVEDACHDVFVECFRENGALSRFDSTRPDGFKPFLYGIVRNIARRVEQQVARNMPTGNHESTTLVAVASDDKCVSWQMDRRWALDVIRKALAMQEERARDSDGAASRRVELLRLRFHNNLPIRKIAELWHEDARHVHNEYARARTDYQNALRDVVGEQFTNLTRREIETKCRALVELLR